MTVCYFKSTLIFEQNVRMSASRTMSVVSSPVSTVLPDSALWYCFLKTPQGGRCQRGGWDTDLGD